MFRGARQDGFEFAQELGDVARANDERRKQPQDVLVRAVDEQAALEGFLRERTAVDGKIDAKDQTLAADFTDEIEAGGKLFESGAKLRAAGDEYSRAGFRLR